jgi:hypothetical protein
MTAEKILQLAQKYRWELLTLGLGLALGNVRWLYNWLGFHGPDPLFEPESAFARYRLFLALFNVPAVLVFGIGAVVLLRRGWTMLAGLWAIVWLPRAWALLAGLWPQPFELLPRLFGLSDQGPVGEWRVWAVNASYQAILAIVVALVAWRFGRLSVLHALLIAAGWLAWRFTGAVNPWDVPPGDTVALGLAWVSVALRVGTLGGLAFAFHEFPNWDRHRQRLAVGALIAVPVLSLAINMAVGLAARPFWRWSDVFSSPTVSFVVSLAASVVVVLSLTWLLASRWPIDHEAGPRTEPSRAN